LKKTATLIPQPDTEIPSVQIYTEKEVSEHIPLGHPYHPKNSAILFVKRQSKIERTDQYRFGMIGINTAFNIRKMKAEATQDPIKILTAKRLKEEFRDLGKLGTSSGEGFYKYPNPSYKKNDFLKQNIPGNIACIVTIQL